MDRQFDAQYWERHYQDSPGAAENDHDRRGSVNPHLVSAVSDRAVSDGEPKTALDAGCGHGIEAAWLAEQGWQVTGVDVSRTALDRAERIVRARGVQHRVNLISADLTTWAPEEPYALVVTHYVHPATPQLKFYRRIADWVRVGGVLLIIGHLQQHGAHDADRASDAPGATHAAQDHGRHNPPEQAQVRAADVVATLDPERWRVDVAEEVSREVASGESAVTLHDVVVRATRLT